VNAMNMDLRDLTKDTISHRYLDLFAYPNTKYSILYQSHNFKLGFLELHLILYSTFPDIPIIPSHKAGWVFEIYFDDVGIPIV
jgi:hypothetical protein